MQRQRLQLDLMKCRRNWVGLLHQYVCDIGRHAVPEEMCRLDMVFSKYQEWGIFAGIDGLFD